MSSNIISLCLFINDKKSFTFYELHIGQINQFKCLLIKMYPFLYVWNDLLLSINCHLVQINQFKLLLFKVYPFYMP